MSQCGCGKRLSAECIQRDPFNPVFTVDGAPVFFFSSSFPASTALLGIIGPDRNESYGLFATKPPASSMAQPSRFARLRIMAHDSADEKQHAHELIDRMAPGQVGAVVGLLGIMLDPLARTLASAPYDDEPVSAEEAREVAAAMAELAGGEGVPREEVLAEFGLASEDFERMGRTPLTAPSL